jgi:hypothetical protein
LRLCSEADRLADYFGVASLAAALTAGDRQNRNIDPRAAQYQASVFEYVALDKSGMFRLSPIGAAASSGQREPSELMASPWLARAATIH